MPGLFEEGYQSATGTRGPSANRKRAASEAARIAMYNQILGDNEIDATSTRELIDLYKNGSDTGTLAAKLAAAREGKGIYAVRKINQNALEVLLDRPGMAQTTFATGTKISPVAKAQYLDTQRFIESNK